MPGTAHVLKGEFTIATRAIMSKFQTQPDGGEGCRVIPQGQAARSQRTKPVTVVLKEAALLRQGNANVRGRVYPGFSRGTGIESGESGRDQPATQG